MDDVEWGAARNLTPGMFRALREAYGLTQKQLAKRLGVSRRSIIRWEQSGPIPILVANAMIGMMGMTDDVPGPVVEFQRLVNERNSLHERFPEQVFVLWAAVARGYRRTYLAANHIRKAAYRLEGPEWSNAAARDALAALKTGDISGYYQALLRLAADTALAHGKDPTAAETALRPFFKRLEEFIGRVRH